MQEIWGPEFALDLIIQATPCQAAAAQLISAGGTQASGLLQALQQQPLLQDTFATAVATLGAVALVKIFEALTSKGIVGQVSKLLSCSPHVKSL